MNNKNENNENNEIKEHETTSSFKLYALVRYLFYFMFIFIVPWTFFIDAFFAKKQYPEALSDSISFMPVAIVSGMAIWLSFCRCPRCKKKFNKGGSVLFNQKVCGSCGLTRNSISS